MIAQIERSATDKPLSLPPLFLGVNGYTLNPAAFPPLSARSESERTRATAARDHWAAEWDAARECLPWYGNAKGPFAAHVKQQEQEGLIRAALSHIDATWWIARAGRSIDDPRWAQDDSPLSGRCHIHGGLLIPDAPVHTLFCGECNAESDGLAELDGYALVAEENGDVRAEELRAGRKAA